MFEPENYKLKSSQEEKETIKCNCEINLHYAWLFLSGVSLFGKLKSIVLCGQSKTDTRPEWNQSES